MLGRVMMMIILLVERGEWCCSEVSRVSGEGSRCGADSPSASDHAPRPLPPPRPNPRPHLVHRLLEPIRVASQLGAQKTVSAETFGTEPGERLPSEPRPLPNPQTPTPPPPPLSRHLVYFFCLSLSLARMHLTDKTTSCNLSTTRVRDWDPRPKEDKQMDK